MKTLKIFHCNSYRAFPNYPSDYTYEIDSNGIIYVTKIKRYDQYETHEIAIYRNWDYLEIEDEEL